MSSSTQEDSAYLEWEPSPICDDEEGPSTIPSHPTNPHHLHIELTHNTNGNITHITTHNGHEIPPKPYILPRGPSPDMHISPSSSSPRKGSRHHNKYTPIYSTWEPTCDSQSSYPTWEDSTQDDNEVGSSSY